MRGLIQSFQKAHILVIGDIILDHYIFGSVDRISPEAPVPIVKVQKKEYKLGGAANVAKNIADLGCKVNIIGLIGNDAAGKKINNLLIKNKIKSFLTKDLQTTIVKTRIIGHNQQLFLVLVF